MAGAAGCRGGIRVSPNTLVSPCVLTTIGWLLSSRVHSWESISKSAATLDVLEPKSVFELSKKNFVRA